MTIAKYSSRLRKSLKGLLAMPKSQATSFTLFINCCYYLKERLETQQDFIAFASLVNSFDISKTILAVIKPLKAGFTLWYRYYQYSRIKDLTAAACILSKYIWKVIWCIVLTGKRRLGLDI